MNARTFHAAAALAALLAALPQAAGAVAPGESRDCVIGPYTVVDVSSAVPGLLDAVTVDRSDEVRAGQVLARLESGVERASLDLAEAWSSIDSEVRIEEISRALDRRRNDRISQLYAGRAVALDDKDKAETEAALSSLRLRQAEEKRWIRELDARKAGAALERRTVRSPIDGVVVERFRTAGEYVENQPILRIAQLDPLQVETILPMGLFGRVAPGMVAEVRTENTPGEALRAVVSVVDRVGDAASGTFGVRLSLDNPGGRIPAGLKCSLAFLEGERAPVPARDQPAAGPAKPGPATVPSAAPAAQPGAPAPVRGADRNGAAAVDPVATAPTPVAPAAAASVAAGPAPGADARCAALGPLDSAEAAGALARSLSGHPGSLARVVHAPVTEREGFIVVSPRQPDLDAAKAFAARAGAAGVKDLAVLHRGEFANRVALGVYTAVDLAQRRRGDLAALGVESEMLERTRTRDAWMVHARLPAGPVPVPAAGVAITPRACGAGESRSAAVPVGGDAAS